MKDACYRKVKSQYKVWPSAYASGALVQCRKVGAENWGVRKNPAFGLEKKYGLHGWFMRGGGKGWIDCKTGKPCGRRKGEKRKYPACRPTKAMCSSAMRKKRGRRRISWVRRNGRMTDKAKADIIARWAYKSAESFVQRQMNPYISGTWPAGIDEANEGMDVPFYISDKLKRMAKGSYWSFQRDKLLAKYPMIRKNPTYKATATVAEMPQGWLWRERGKIYKSAGAVVKAMQKESNLTVKRGMSAVIRQISWVPSTPAGTRIVKAIMSNQIQSNPVPPREVAQVACGALADRKRYKRGGTAVGVARARDLCRGANVSNTTLKRMRSYFARHRASRNENARRLADRTSAASIADRLWGGTAGMRWAERF